MFATYRTLPISSTSSGRPNSVALTALDGGVGVDHDLVHVERDPLERADLVLERGRIPPLSGVAEPRDLEGVQLPVGQVATLRRDELVDRPAVQLVDHDHAPAPEGLDALVAQDADLPANLDLDRLRWIVRFEEDLEQAPARGLLRKEHGAPGRPPEPVETPVGGRLQILRDHLGVARLEVDDRHGAVRAHLVGAVEVAPGADAVLVQRVHVGEVVDTRIDVKGGLVRD